MDNPLYRKRTHDAVEDGADWLMVANVENGMAGVGELGDATPPSQDTVTPSRRTMFLTVIISLKNRITS